MKTEMVGFTFESRRPYITWNALLKLIKKARTKAASENRTFYVFVTPNNIYSQVTICLLQITYYFILATLFLLDVSKIWRYRLLFTLHSILQVLFSDWDDDNDVFKT